MLLEDCAVQEITVGNLGLTIRAFSWTRVGVNRGKWPVDLLCKPAILPYKHVTNNYTFLIHVIRS